MNKLFRMFLSSQFLNIVNESDEKLYGEEDLERNTIRADVFCNKNGARHNAEIVRSSSNSTQSSGDDLERNRYRTNDTFYEQYDKSSLSK